MHSEDSKLIQLKQYQQKLKEEWAIIKELRATGGDLERLKHLKFLHENGYPCNKKIYSRFAATNGHLECLKYLHENGCPCDTNETTDAALGNHLECLKYLHENGCPLDKKAIKLAIRHGQLECLKYLHENGCSWNKKSTRYVAKYGHLECLKYLRANGCPLDEDASIYAANNGHLDCLKYLRVNGCPWHNAIPVDIKVNVWWSMLKDLVKIRPKLLFWQEQTVLQVYSETGYGRKRDRSDFERDFI